MNSAECYDPETNKWHGVASMSVRRSGLACISHRGYLYALGGYTGTMRVNSGEKYNPSTDKWTPICDMPNPRSNFGVAVMDDMIFVIGGFNGMYAISNTECYVADKNEWYAWIYILYILHLNVIEIFYIYV